VGYLLARAFDADEDSRARITAGTAMAAIGSMVGGALVGGHSGTTGAVVGTLGAMGLLLGVAIAAD
jgi:hypothetical protein